MSQLSFDFIPEKLKKMQPSFDIITRSLYLLMLIMFISKLIYEYVNNLLDNPIYWGIVAVFCIVLYLILWLGYAISLTNKGFTKRTINAIITYQWSDFKRATRSYSLVGSESIKLTTHDDKTVKLMGSYFEHHKAFKKILEYYSNN